MISTKSNQRTPEIMIDRKHIGLELPPHTAKVEKGRLKFFAKATGQTDPIYTDEDAAIAAGYPSLPAPPTFLFCLDMEVPNPFEMLDRLGVELGKILHGEQTFTYHRTVCAGDKIIYRSRVADIFDKKDGALEFIIKETAVTDEDDRKVADLKSVIVVRNA